MGRVSNRWSDEGGPLRQRTEHPYCCVVKGKVKFRSVGEIVSGSEWEIGFNRQLGPRWCTWPLTGEQREGTAEFWAEGGQERQYVGLTHSSCGVACVELTRPAQ